MGTTIHPTALIGEHVELGDGCRIGPYVVIEDGAVLGEDNELNAFCYLTGATRLGSRNRLMRGASLGGEPQSQGYKGEPTRLIVGNDNWLGENLTIHRGTAASGETVVGDHNFLMAYTHVGHDCRLGNHIVMANDAQLGGHTTLHDRVNMGAAAGVHQHTRIGELVMVAALARVVRDVMPFTMIEGENNLLGLNRVGLRRAGYATAQSAALKTPYRMLCVQRRPVPEVLAWLRAQPANPVLEAWSAFLAGPSKRGFARTHLTRHGAPQDEADAE